MNEDDPLRPDELVVLRQMITSYQEGAAARRVGARFVLAIVGLSSAIAALVFIGDYLKTWINR